MRIASFAFAACLTGCASYVSPTNMLLGSPPSLDSVKAEIDARGCAGSQRFDQSSYQNPNRETPNRVEGCLASLPKTLLDARVQGRCTSMFDLDEAGRPINPETRCNVGSPRMQLSSEWAAFATSAFLYAVEKQLATWRYQASDEPSSAKRRHNLHVSTFFGIGGERVAFDWPQPFQRPPPAPPLPPDLIEKAAKANPTSSKPPLNPN
jgi:hypothetical protein